MKRVALIDTETTGINPAIDRVVEVAICLYDLELGCPLESYASLVRSPDNAAERHNRIPPAALVEANHPIEVWRRVVALAETADVVAAHNAAFDRSFVRAAGIASLSDDKVWACTMADFEWDGGGRSLTAVALNLGLGVASAHRALTDVDTMARVLTRMRELGADLPALFRRATRPKKRFVAMVSFDMKQVAKDAGFMWSPETREWWRMMCPDDIGTLSFRVVERSL